MQHRRVAFEEELLDGVECFAGEFLKETQAEGLRAGRVHAVKDHVGATARHPCGVAFGKETTSGDGVLRAGEAFRAFQPFGQIKV